MSDTPGRGSPWGEPAAPSEDAAGRPETARHRDTAAVPDAPGGRSPGTDRPRPAGGGARRSGPPADPAAVAPPDVRSPLGEPSPARGAPAEAPGGPAEARSGPPRRPGGAPRSRPVASRRPAVDTGPGSREKGTPVTGTSPAGTGDGMTGTGRASTATIGSTRLRAPAGATATSAPPVSRVVDPTGGIVHLPYRRSRWTQLRAMVVLVVVSLAIGTAVAGTLGAIVWGFAVAIRHAAAN